MAFKNCSFLWPLLLASTLLSASNGFAQPSGNPQDPQPSGQPQRAAIIQSRMQFMGSCLPEVSNAQQRSYCTCVFDSLIRRYTIQEYQALNNLIIHGGPAFAQFASLVWSPEFNACKVSFPAP
jgi:hypothetical protein